jgi:hypothetical protein
LDRGNAEILQQDSAQMPICYSETCSEIRNASLLKTSGLDLFNGGRSKSVGGIGRRLTRGKFRSAPQAGTKSCHLRGRSQSIEFASFQSRSLGPANRPAIDPGRFHRNKKVTIEPRVMRQHRLVTLVAI